VVTISRMKKVLIIRANETAEEQEPRLATYNLTLDTPSKCIDLIIKIYMIVHIII